MCIRLETNQRKSSPITFQVTGSNARLPICLVSGNPAERLGDEWVQTRGYQACVVYMPIPLRVCLAGAPTNYKAFLLDYRKPTKLPPHYH